MTREQIISTLASHRDLLDRFGVRELRLFGSVARGDAAPDSDIDLLVEFVKPTGYFKLLRLQNELSRVLGKPIDLGTPDSLHKRIRERVIRESIRAA